MNTLLTWKAALHLSCSSSDCMACSKQRYLIPPASRMAYCWGVLLKAKIDNANPAFNLMCYTRKETHIDRWKYLSMCVIQYLRNVIESTMHHLTDKRSWQLWIRNKCISYLIGWLQQIQQDIKFEIFLFFQLFLVVMVIEYNTSQGVCHFYLSHK